jgi:Flp pilus assembly pilin Flp
MSKVHVIFATLETPRKKETKATLVEYALLPYALA